MDALEANLSLATGPAARTIRRGQVRPAASLGAVAAALLLSSTVASAGDRCCFRIDAAVAGQAVATGGADLERPGAYAYRARWSLEIRHIARYVEHGRIFNALTALGTRPSTSAVFVHFSETRRSIRGATCRHSFRGRLTVGSGRAYVSLEDGPDGRITLVLHAQLSRLRPRCNSSVVIPAAQVTRAPAGVALRRAPGVSLSWQERVGADGAGSVRGDVAVHVRLRFISERLARSFAPRPD
jgi:hypothetical protein